MKGSFKKKLFFILNHISASISYVDATTLHYKFVNKEFAEAYHIPREQIIGRQMKEILPAINYQNALKYIEKVKKGKTVTYEHYFDIPSGNRWVKVDYIPEFDTRGNVISFIVIATDISDRKVAERKLQKSEARFRFIVETANEGILMLNHDLEIVYVNNKLVSMLNYKIEELMGVSFKSLLFEDQLKDFELQFKKRMQGEDAIYERCLKRKDGSKHWVTVSAKLMLDDEEHYSGLFVMFTDIHSRKLVETQLENAIKKLEILSNIDGLTNLPNRRYFDEIVSSEYDRLSRFGAELSFIMIDIDFFKDFNDCYGHISGDNGLRQVAKVLAGSIFCPADIVARYGGEEFICMLPETNMEDAGVIAEKMRTGVESLRICHKGSNISDYVTISLGVATIKCSPSQTVLEIIGNADKALYKAKANGRNRIEFFNLMLKGANC